MARRSQSTVSRIKNSVSHMGSSSSSGRGRSSSSRSSSSRGSSSRGSSSRGRSSSSRSRSSRGSSFLGISGLPSWAPLTLSIVGVCGLVYGLMQITSVRDFVEPMIDDVGEFFGLMDEEGIDSTNITHDRTYSSVVGS